MKMGNEGGQLHAKFLTIVARATAMALVCLSFVCSAAFAQTGARKVAEIRYVGLVSFTPRDIENALPFALGDAWRDDSASATRQAVIEYYNRRGFYHAKVDVVAAPIPMHPQSVHINLRIEEGAPCTIKSIWIDDPTGFKSKYMMLRFKDRIDSVLGVKAGDRYDEQVLAEKLRALREWMGGQDFILANTERVRVTFNDDKSEADIVFAIDYGDRVTIGFQNNTVFSRGELDDMIDQLRATGLGKDYVGAIERRFYDEYKAKAYNDIKISVVTREVERGKHVTFAFDEGVRTELQEISWDGVTTGDISIIEEAFQKASSRLVQRGYFVEKDIDKAILLVIEDLKSRGYLAAKLISRSVQKVKSPKGTHRVRISIQLAQGEQTRVSEIDLEGFTHIPLPTVLDTLGVHENAAFNPFALEEGLQRLKTNYTNDGYLDFRIVTDDDRIVRFSENNRAASIELKIHEGLRAKVGNIRIVGLRKTREFVVTREITLHEGDWWLASDIQEMENNLRKLGLFNEVKIVPEQSPFGPGYRDLVVRVEEGEPGIVEFGPGFRSDLGLKTMAGVSYNNILGRNWVGSLTGEANRRIGSEYRFIEYNLDMAFVEPRFLGSRFRYNIELSTRKERIPPDFNKVSTEVSTGFERKLSKILTARTSYRLERIRQFDVYYKGIPLPEDNRSMLIGSIIPSATIDTRDSPFATTSGWLLNGSVEWADPRFSAQPVGDDAAPGYQKWSGSVHRYTSLGKDIVWSKVLAAGYARSNYPKREIPLNKLFRLGGYSTIRGFSEDEINVDSQKVTGTLTYINLRTQVDLPFVGELRFAPFLDAGNLSVDRIDKTLRVGWGFGFHYMTPVGPINLDIGWKWNPTPEESPYQIHFSVGLI